MREFITFGFFSAMFGIAFFFLYSILKGFINEKSNDMTTILKEIPLNDVFKE